MNNKKTLLILVSFLLIAFVIESEAKRSFSIRTRSKSNSGRQYSSRRKGHDNGQPDNPSGGLGSMPASESRLTNHQPLHGNVERTERQAVPISKGHAPDLNNRKPAQSPNEPPPPYPGLTGTGTSNGALPPYSRYESPPSYSASGAAVNSQAGNVHYSNGYGYPPAGSNIQSIPPRGQTYNHGLDATSFQGLGPGHNTFGGPSGIGTNYNQYTNIGPPNGGGLYNNYNYNGQSNGGMAGGAYGSGYGYGQGASSPFSFGNVLTGLALWNVARGFNSYPNHHQNIHIHDHNNKSNEPSAVPDLNNNNNNNDNINNNNNNNSDITPEISKISTISSTLTPPYTSNSSTPKPNDKHTIRDLAHR